MPLNTYLKGKHTHTHTQTQRTQTLIIPIHFRKQFGSSYFIPSKSQNLFFLMFTHFWETERQSTRGERQREGDTETKAGSKPQAVSTEPKVGLEPTDGEIMTWAEVRRPTDWATQAPLKVRMFTIACKALHSASPLPLTSFPHQHHLAPATWLSFWPEMLLFRHQLAQLSHFKSAQVSFSPRDLWPSYLTLHPLSFAFPCPILLLLLPIAFITF